MVQFIPHRFRRVSKLIHLKEAVILETKVAPILIVQLYKSFRGSGDGENLGRLFRACGECQQPI